jgi:hypothetical protein
MKVKFLKDGRWAHQNIGDGQFDFKEGDEMSGICEADAIVMKEAGIATIMGDDTVEEEVVDDADGDSDDEDSKSDDAGEPTSDDTNGNKKPWEK